MHDAQSRCPIRYFNSYVRSLIYSGSNGEAVRTQEINDA